MNEQVSQLIERLKQAQNVLVTVSKDPSVDQLSAAIGLTLALNALDKHATAVYSGQTPSTIDFLKPEETLEGNTDSLRDFIIALDKSKADKLRYKVEDQVVRIFITPYRTSISEQDLQFSQGDFNVDVVVALGVRAQQDLDDAVQAHGRILHDATVASLSTGEPTELGTINIVDAKASSLSEMVTKIIEALSKKAIDGQIATALLTGIVATTERFSNEKTTPDTMSVSAKLMEAGANQQLIATELAAPEEPEQPSEPSQDEQAQQEQPREPGMLEIDHSAGEPQPEQQAPQIQVDEHGNLSHHDAADHPTRERIIEPPTMDGTLSANTTEEALSPPLEELTLPSPSAPPTLSHDHRTLLPEQPENEQQDDTFAPEVDAPSGMPYNPAEDAEGEFPAEQAPEPTPEPAPQPEPTRQPAWQPAPEPAQPEPQYNGPSATELAASDDVTLSQIEQTVHSPHVQSAAPSGGDNIDEARDALQAAFQGAPQPPEPVQALNAQPLGYELHESEPADQPAFAQPPQFAPPQPAVTNPGFNEPSPGDTPVDATLDMPMPSSPFAAPHQQQPQPMPQPGQQQPGNDEQAPPVPPPFVPPVN